MIYKKGVFNCPFSYHSTFKWRAISNKKSSHMHDNGTFVNLSIKRLNKITHLGLSLRGTSICGPLKNFLFWFSKRKSSFRTKKMHDIGDFVGLHAMVPMHYQKDPYTANFIIGKVGHKIGLYTILVDAFSGNVILFFLFSVPRIWDFL